MTDKKTEALKLALELLDKQWQCTQVWSLEEAQDVADNIREALASEAIEHPAHPQQEPVAVVSGYYGGQCVILPIDPARIFNSNTALYTSPPTLSLAQRQARSADTWVGLTDEEIDVAWNNCEAPYGFAEDIEAKLKEKNTP